MFLVFRSMRSRHLLAFPRRLPPVKDFCIRWHSSSPVQRAGARQEHGPDKLAVHLTAIINSQVPAKTLKLRLQNRTLTKPVAFQCLQKLDALNHTEENLERDLLDWLRKKHTEDIQYPHDNHLIRLVIQLALRENQEEKIWGWIGQPGSKIIGLGSEHHCQWRTSAFEGLLLAKAQSGERSSSLDEALRAFFRGVESRVIIPRIWRVYSVLEGQLSKFQNHLSDKPERWVTMYPNTDLQLWTSFVEYRSPPPDSGTWALELHYYNWARLMLFRPQNPDPRPLFRFLRQVNANPNHGYHTRQGSRKILSDHRNILYATELARQYGYEQEYEWMEVFREQVGRRR